MKRVATLAALVCALGATLPVQAGSTAPFATFVGAPSFTQSAITANSVTGMLGATIFASTLDQLDTFNLGLTFSNTAGAINPVVLPVVVFDFAASTPAGTCDSYVPPPGAFDVTCTIFRPFTFTGASPGGNVFMATLLLTSDNTTAQIPNPTATAQFTAQQQDVPEPMTLALLGAGLAGLALSRRRTRI